jgi:actin-related protein 8
MLQIIYRVYTIAQYLIAICNFLTSKLNISRLDPSDQETVIGSDVFYLDPSRIDYDVRFPIRRGDLNLHSDVGGSLTSVLVDLAAIWTHAIQSGLGIPLGDLERYRAVLVIPALYNRAHIKHFISLLLNDLGFGGCFVLQDHVAATFGAGLGYACVVDVGDQKTSVSCVEDGVSHPETRIHMDCGGSDISAIFHYFLRDVGFPYKECLPASNALDARLIHQLKEDSCHLDLDTCGLQKKSFEVAQPGEFLPTKLSMS